MRHTGCGCARLIPAILVARYSVNVPKMVETECVCATSANLARLNASTSFPSKFSCDSRSVTGWNGTNITTRGRTGVPNSQHASLITSMFGLPGAMRCKVHDESIWSSYAHETGRRDGEKDRKKIIMCGDEGARLERLVRKGYECGLKLRTVCMQRGARQKTGWQESLAAG